MSRILMFTSVISLWSYFMFYIACFSTYDVLLKRLCHSCNFILSPYYCFVHVDLVVTLFFFFLDKWFSCDLCCICLHFHIQTEFCFHSIIYQSFPVSYLPNIEPVGQPRETKRVPWFIEPPATTLNLLRCQLAPLLEVPLDVGAVVTQAIPMYFEKDSSLQMCIFK